uniref:Ubiquitin-like modifier-activating enzyme Atg7 N-terminal domain-containing protein n=1 Tax=Amphimedon queenslandica TaxID=400682 RepID=A0A1X7TYS6_AMPQE
ILNSNLGWPLRNFLYFISHTWGNVLKEVDILCYCGNTQDWKCSNGRFGWWRAWVFLVIVVMMILFLK